MVEYTVTLDDIFYSLADPTRRDMLRRLGAREQSVGQLAAHYELTFAAISKHVQVLERAKLVRKHRRGREQRVELSAGGLRKADQYLEQYRAVWEEKLDRLEKYVRSKK